MATATAQTDSAKARVKELLELTGSGKLGIQVMNSIIGTYKEQMPDIPTEFWDKFMSQVQPSNLVDLLIPIYTKYYSDDEIMQLIEFYKTTIGQKVIEMMPLYK